MAQRVELTTRCSVEEAAIVRAAALRLGVSISTYLTLCSMERARSDAIVEQVSVLLVAAHDEQAAQLAEFRTEVTEALGAAVAGALDEHKERLNEGLKAFAAWAEKRWPIAAPKRENAS